MNRFSYLKTMPKSELILWTVIRLCIVGWFFYEIFNASTKDAFQALFSLIFTFLWDMFQIFGGNSFIKNVSSHAQTALTIFIFLGSFLSKAFNLFFVFEWYDILLHIVSGAICAWFGYDFACIIQRKKGQCAATLAAIFGLMFALSIAVGWEFYEFLMDTLHGTNLQLAKPGEETAMFDLSKYNGEYGYLGLWDTMTDMMMNAVGGIAGMIFMIILRNRKKRKK